MYKEKEPCSQKWRIGVMVILHGRSGVAVSVAVPKLLQALVDVG